MNNLKDLQATSEHYRLLQEGKINVVITLYPGDPETALLVLDLIAGMPTTDDPQYSGSLRMNLHAIELKKEGK